jgi:hypothetical protein
MANSAAHDAVSQLYNDISPELCFIRALANVIALCPERNAGPETVEALAASVVHMADAMEAKLEQALKSGGEVSHA